MKPRCCPYSGVLLLPHVSQLPCNYRDQGNNYTTCVQVHVGLYPSRQLPRALLLNRWNNHGQTRQHDDADCENQIRYPCEDVTESQYHRDGIHNTDEKQSHETVPAFRLKRSCFIEFMDSVFVVPWDTPRRMDELVQNA